MNNLHYTETDKKIAAETAKILLDIKAVNFNIEEPYTLTAGWVSPVYVDCRKIISYPNSRSKIIDLSIEKIHDKFGYDYINAVSGGETAGIPFAAWIADRLHCPMTYVRKQQKAFGKKSLIEGDVIKGQTTLLVEDLATDGGSKVHFLKALKDSDVETKHVFVVFSYDVFSFQMLKALYNNGVSLDYLCNWWDILNAAAKYKYLEQASITEITQFLYSPMQWSEDHGGRAS